MSTRRHFARYCAVGVANTAVHGMVFFALHSLWGASQASSNLAGFMAAVTLSFCLNARFTFDSYRSWRRYCVYVGFMGCVSLGIGALGDHLSLSPAVTLIGFCAFSLVIGFLFSRYVVFAGWLS